MIGSAWLFFDFSFINYFSLEFKLFDLSFYKSSGDLLTKKKHSFGAKKLETDNFTLKNIIYI